MPTESRPACGCRRCRAFRLVAEIDAAARQIVGRNLDDDPVADAGADAELAHLARHVGEDLMFVVEGDPVIAVRQDLGHRAVEFQQLFLRHASYSLMTNTTAARAARIDCPLAGALPSSAA